MRDFGRTSGKAVGKSLGYGFVSFTDHQHALSALRHTNNNPDIFGENKVSLVCEINLYILNTVKNLSNYSQTSIAQTPMARLPWLIRTRF